jgi:SAM-dependent methyltransferase
MSADGPKDIFGLPEAIELLKQSSLEVSCPPLARFLRAGMSALDVGCGPGCMALDVASRIAPGPIIGLEREPASIAVAAALGSERAVGNAHFLVGDAHELPFEPERFDLCYSIHALEWLPDPLRALREQRRVTRRGGKVIAAVGDWGTRVMFPRCPALERIWSALDALREPGDPQHFFAPRLGRETASLFTEAGFSDLTVESFIVPRGCAIAGQEHFADNYTFLKWLVWNEGGFGPRLRKLIERGLFDTETLTEANLELDRWFAHPRAIQMNASFLVSGTVPCEIGASE